jgi:adenylylsulfate kinase
MRPPRSPNTTIVAFAGLPGTGKSTLARRVASELAAPLLDKDRVRDALFGPDHVAYTREQDDFVVEILFTAIEHLLAYSPPEFVVLDGRTFSKKDQVEALRRFARARKLELRILQCACSPETARARIELDERSRAHPAANRSFALHQALSADADPISNPKRVVRTDGATVDELVGVCLKYARAPRSDIRSATRRRKRRV